VPLMSTTYGTGFGTDDSGVLFVDVDYYKILGVARDCHPDEVRSAYRQRLLKLHPDKNPNADPEEYQRVQLAYETLNDVGLRLNYDAACGPDSSTARIEGDYMFKAFVQLKRYSQSMDIFNRLREWEEKFGIPREKLRCKQGATDGGFRGFTSPLASSYALPYRVYGVCRVPSYPLEPPG
jgi:curved DNA-binding protein CbpA